MKKYKYVYMRRANMRPIYIKEKFSELLQCIEYFQTYLKFVFFDRLLHIEFLISWYLLKDIANIVSIIWSLLENVLV